MTEPICKIDVFGNKRWHLNGELHREDGPAIEFADGTISWYLNGVFIANQKPENWDELVAFSIVGQIQLS